MFRTSFLLALVLLPAAACGKKSDKTPSIQTAAVERRDIVVDAQATGVVEPINVVEVKSKASGLITRMTVETGNQVKAGDLLVQVDTRDVRNQYDQTLADVRAAEAKLAISRAQKKRADDLAVQRIITAQEHEAAQLDFANAQAQLVRAQTSLDLAQQRLEDATVRAPVAGTIIDKTVSLGQVITSATGAFGGGTTLLKMADLTKVRVRALVNESDIGNVKPGQGATVTVDAYPDRPFQGLIEKIEPQAVVQQSVTMFPVLVSLENREGLLKPGMNGEVSILVSRRAGVLSIPNDAVKNMREAAAVAAVLGLNPDSVTRLVRAQMAGAMGGGDAPVAVPVSATGSAGTPVRNARGMSGGDGQAPSMPPADSAGCAAVAAALAKTPDARSTLDALRGRVQAGELDMQAARAESQKIYAAAGVDPQAARGCMQRGRGQRGGGGGGAGEGGRGAGASDAGGSGGRARTALVFVGDSGKYEPRVVRLGASNFDYVEVVSGLKEGEQVALLAAASLQFAREQQQNRIRGMTGGGVPGMQRQPAGAAGAGAAGGGSVRRGGGPGGL